MGQVDLQNYDVRKGVHFYKSLLVSPTDTVVVVSLYLTSEHIVDNDLSHSIHPWTELACLHWPC